jgi:hypothetical protein
MTADGDTGDRIRTALVTAGTGGMGRVISLGRRGEPHLDNHREGAARRRSHRRAHRYQPPPAARNRPRAVPADPAPDERSLAMPNIEDYALLGDLHTAALPLGHASPDRNPVSGRFQVISANEDAYPFLVLCMRAHSACRPWAQCGLPDKGPVKVGSSWPARRGRRWLRPCA